MKNYPILKQRNNEQGGYQIVLFTDANVGVVVESTYSPSTPIGSHGFYDESVFVEFHGTIRLNNEVLGYES